jgi:putative ABC transport system permease protein
MAIGHDFKAALRALRRAGSLPIVVVVMLSIAIAAVTVIFSIADAVLIRPISVTDPGRVMVLWGRDEARSQSVVEIALADLRAWRAGATGFTQIEVFGSVNWGELDVKGPGEPFRATQSFVSAGFFDVFGTRPILGRTFRPEDDSRHAPGVVIVSEGLWRRQFSADAGIIGRLLRVGEGKSARAVEVVGVMPSAFRIPAGAEVWIPIGPGLVEAENVRAMYGVGRLRDTTTPQSAAAALSTIARNEERKNGHPDSSMVVVAMPLLSHLLGPARPALFAIGGASAVLLLIACANAAALLLVQGASRRREVAVRLALGARRSQIIRQLLSEAVVLSLAAGALGVALAYVSFESIVALAPIEVPRLDEAAVDARALTFTFAVCNVVTLLVGLLPAWQHDPANLMSGLHQRSERGTMNPASVRVRKTLVAAQLSAAVVLLTAAGLFTRSFVSLLRLDLGFDPKGVLTFNLAAPESRYDTREKQWQLVDAVLGRAKTLPHVASAGAVHLRPFAFGVIGMDSGVIVEGQPLSDEAFRRNPILNWEVATPDYFSAMDIRLLSGRTFDDRDTEKAPPVVIVSESLAARLWPGQHAVGRRLLTQGAPGIEEKKPVWQTVVGVVETARYREVESARFDIYLPYRQAPDPVQHFMVRVTGEPMAIVPSLKAALVTIDRELTADNVTTMEQIVGRAFAPWRFSTVIVSIFSAMALTFAAVGLAALVAFAVSHRTREIGVRIALGAQRSDVIRLLLGEGAWLACIGLSTGILIAWVVKRSIASMLFGISPDDAATFVGVAALLLIVAMAAAYLPARRAASIDPAVTLRSE